MACVRHGINSVLCVARLLVPSAACTTCCALCELRAQAGHTVCEGRFTYPVLVLINVYAQRSGAAAVNQHTLAILASYGPLW
jgi:hypothetical protein